MCTGQESSGPSQGIACGQREVRRGDMKAGAKLIVRRALELGETSTQSGAAQLMDISPAEAKAILERLVRKGCTTELMGRYQKR